MMPRGGGKNGGDFQISQKGGGNCSSLCENAMRLMGLSIWPGSDPFYFKCFDGISNSPLNGRRIQYASQVGTLLIDPIIPQMNITDVKACHRMIYLEKRLNY